MKQTINFTDFCDAFIDSQYQENFTYDGKRALFDYLEQYEQDTGEEIELDICAICCDYSEDPLSEVLENYSLEDLDELRDRTMVVDFDEASGLVIYQVF